MVPVKFGQNVVPLKNNCVSMNGVLLTGITLICDNRTKK